MKDAGYWASEVLANLTHMTSITIAVRMIQSDAIRHAAEHASKTADCIGQDDPATGELSEANMFRQDGAYRVVDRLYLLADETSKDPQ